MDGLLRVPRMAVTWSDLDDAILRRMFSEGATTKQVAEALGQTQEAVSSRRLELIRESAAREPGQVAAR